MVTADDFELSSRDPSLNDQLEFAVSLGQHRLEALSQALLAIVDGQDD